MRTYIDIGDWDWRNQSQRLSKRRLSHTGATTGRACCPIPLRARFGITGHMEYYEASDLTEIVERQRLDILPTRLLGELALRSRGTPRVANRLPKRVRDYAQIMGNGLIDDKITDRSSPCWTWTEKGFRLCGPENPTNHD